MLEEESDRDHKTYAMRVEMENWRLKLLRHVRWQWVGFSSGFRAKNELDERKIAFGLEVLDMAEVSLKGLSSEKRWTEGMVALDC